MPDDKIEKVDTKSTTITDENIPCVQIMDKVFKGEVWLLPLFAQSLISFLYEDMPQNPNPRFMAHHVATKGAYVLSEAMKMSKEQEMKEEEKKKIEFQKQSDPILTIGLSFACGNFFHAAEYIKFLLCAAYIFKTSQFHDQLPEHNKSYSNYVIFVMIAYAYYY